MFSWTDIHSQLEKEYSRIRSPLHALAEKEIQKGKKQLVDSQNLGFSQAFEYGERSIIRFVVFGCGKSLLT